MQIQNPSMDRLARHFVDSLDLHFDPVVDAVDSFDSDFDLDSERMEQIVNKIVRLYGRLWRILSDSGWNSVIAYHLLNLLGQKVLLLILLLNL